MSVVLLERPADHVALVRFNRPDALNALNTEVRQLIHQHFTDLAADPDVRCIILTGNEKSFAAGADIKEQAKRDTVDAMTMFNSRALMECPKPIIAAVNGFALGGGCEYAMQCDIIVANQKAKFGQPEVKLGLIPGAGGTQRLTRVVGKFNSMYLNLTGNFISAADAHRMGLACEVMEGDALPRALELAKQIAAMAPLAVAQIKEAVLFGQDASLDTALRFERKGYQLMFATEDKKEGVAAFIEKRQAAFKGR